MTASFLVFTMFTPQRAPCAIVKSLLLTTIFKYFYQTNENISLRNGIPPLFVNYLRLQLKIRFGLLYETFRPPLVRFTDPQNRLACHHLLALAYHLEKLYLLTNLVRPQGTNSVTLSPPPGRLN